MRQIITAVETFHTRIPFSIGSDPVAFSGVAWQALDTFWVRITTDQGLHGWGEGFGHASSAATRLVFDTQLAPAALARAFGVRLVAHCAYFGAGHLASLHLAAAFAPDQPFERLFIDLEDSPYHDLVLAPGGRMRVPDGPGLGRDPDMDVIRRYQVGQTTRLVP